MVSGYTQIRNSLIFVIRRNSNSLKSNSLKKKYHIYKVLSVLLIVLLFAGCKKENACDCIKRTGEITTQKREISGFDKIIVYENINVFISQDSIFEVIVEAGKNLRGLIITEVTDGTLEIKNKNRCNWARSYKEPINVYIKMPVIKYITSDGTGTIRSLNTITTGTFDVRTKNSGNIELTVNNDMVISHMHGAGDITLHGYTAEHACDIGGTAFLKCQDLQTKYTSLHTFTTGLCYVKASEHLLCIIDKIGDVYCYGNPTTVDKTRHGQGQLYLE